MAAILEMHKNRLVDENGTILFEAGPDPARLLDKYYTCSMSADVGLAVGKAMEGRHNYCELGRSLSIDSFVYSMDCMTGVYFSKHRGTQCRNYFIFRK